MYDLTRHTVVDRRRLKLPAPDQVAVDEEEYALGIHCLAAPVVEPGHVAAVGVVVSPATRARNRSRGRWSSAPGGCHVRSSCDEACPQFDRHHLKHALW